jgi:hypothetical protein
VRRALYRPRQPERTALRQILVHSLKSTRAALDADEVYLPRFVWRELEAIIDCGDVHKGFVRVVCGSCKHERVVGFSCKGRGVCSSCVGRKMNELAYHLDDHVVPLVPIRQFVLTLPIQLRFLVARDPKLLSAVRAVFLRAVSGLYRRTARAIAMCKALRTAGLCVAQRFGSALNLNPHLHSIFVDGAYRDDDDGKPVFVATPAVEKKAADRLLARIVAQLFKMLRRRGIITAEEWSSPEENTPDAQLTLEAMRVPVAPTQPASLHSSSASVLCGFSLHCASRASAHDQAARLRLFRYVLRPAIATDKLTFDGKTVTFAMKRAFSDGLSVLRFSPQAFIRRIAQLVPRPRQHEIVYCGLFASNAKDRAKVVRVATHRKRAKNHPAHDPTAPSSTMSWQELLKRTFAIDLQKCDQCAGSVRIIATITERAVIAKILSHLGLASGHGAPASPRAPPPVVHPSPTS